MVVGGGVHLIQLLCHHLFTVHMHTPPLTTCIRKDGTNGEAAGVGVGRGDKGSEPSNRSQSIPPSTASPRLSRQEKVAGLTK